MQPDKQFYPHDSDLQQATRTYAAVSLAILSAEEPDTLHQRALDILNELL